MHMQSVVMADSWRLTRYLDEDEGQMFDLSEEPGEQEDLYRRTEHAAKRQELLERLIRVGFRPYNIPQYRSLADHRR